MFWVSKYFNIYCPGSSGSLPANIISVEVVLPGGNGMRSGFSRSNSEHPQDQTTLDGGGSDSSPNIGGGGRRGPELAAWSWSSHPERMAALFSGLGMIAAVTSVTLKCIPLYRLE